MVPIVGLKVTSLIEWIPYNMGNKGVKIPYKPGPK